MFKAIKTIILNDEVRLKVFATLLGLFIIRIFSFIPVPWTDIDMLKNMSNTGILALTSLFNGSSMSVFSIGAIGVSAYISATIFIQLASFFIKPLHRLRSEPGGGKFIRIITVTLGFVLAFLTSLITVSVADSNIAFLLDDSWYVFVIIATIQATCASISIYIGEKITDYGFCEGLPLIILANILSSIPEIYGTITNKYEIGQYTTLTIIIFLIVIGIMYIAVSFMENSERKIPVNYIKETSRQVNILKPKSELPIRFNFLGVMPIIIGVYMVALIQWIGAIISPELSMRISDILEYGSSYYILLTSIFIFFGGMFYSYVLFDANEVAFHLQTRGGLIENIRPGKHTAIYLRGIVNQMSVLSSIYMVVITMIPLYILSQNNINMIETTSIIIIFDVSIMAIRTLKSEIKLNNVKKF
mgnify:CR=1 FL=1